uniref:DNA repair protein RAD51 homolog 3 n=1 Tax=Oryza glumipatula TaxID=40148 RepID=A0A0D9YAU9_9ORYZ
MEIADLPIATSHRANLLAAGYSSLAALSTASPPRLARDLSIEVHEAEEILKVAVGANKSKGADGPSTSSVLKGVQNAWDMLSDEQSRRHINTGSADLNNILGGGIHCKEVTEIVTGLINTSSLIQVVSQESVKLNWGMLYTILNANSDEDFTTKDLTFVRIQLAINVQIPVEYGGLGGKAVYIDTEGSFMVERVYQIAEGCISDILEYFPHCHDKAPAGQEKLKPESFLADIYYFRICSYTEQIAVINYLEKFLGEHKDVRIVIIDSVTFHFRQDFDDMALRTRVLSGLSLKLMKLSKAYNLAVVLLNQVTTKFTEGSFQLTLALGDSWSHSCTNRLILYWNGNERYGYLDKSPSLPVASAPYAVTVKGVRDAVNSNSKRVRFLVMPSCVNWVLVLEQ